MTKPHLSTMAYDPNNVFAKILKGEIPCAKIYEDALILAFMDAFPQGEGHCLVIPKAPAVDIFDIAPHDLKAVIEGTQKIAKAAQAALEFDGVRIFQFNAKSAGQTVFHLHFHILPMWEGRPINPHSAGVMADINHLNAIAARIAAKL